MSPAREVYLVRPGGPSRGEWLSSAFESSGFVVTELPVLEIVPAASDSEILSALHAVRARDWLVFTSGNAVRISCETPGFVALAREKGARFAVVGRKTANILASFGIKAELVPAHESGAGLLAELRGALEKDGAGMLFLRGRIAAVDFVRELSRDELRSRELVVYELRRRHLSDAEQEKVLRLLLRDTDSSLIVAFTSGEMVRALWELLAPIADRQTLLTALSRFRLAVIGHETGRALEELGLTASIVPATPSLEALHEAIVSA